MGGGKDAVLFAECLQRKALAICCSASLREQNSTSNTEL